MSRGVTAQGRGEFDNDLNADRVWYVERQGRLVGPLTTIELAMAAKHGMLRGPDRLWRVGLPRWFVATEVAGLLPAEPAPARFEPYASSPIHPSNAVAALAASQPLPAPPISFPPLSQAAGAELRAVGRSGLRAELSGLHRPPGPESAVREGVQVEVLLPKEISPLDRDGASQSKTFSERVADNIAQQIVLMMDRYEITKLDDLTSNDKLRKLSDYTFDAVPWTIRTALVSAVGRDFVIERIFDLLLLMRSRISPETRSEDLRRIVLDNAPFIAALIEQAIEGSVGKVGDLVKTNWNAALGKLWGDPNPAPAAIAEEPLPQFLIARA